MTSSTIDPFDAAIAKIVQRKADEAAEAQLREEQARAAAEERAAKAKQERLIERRREFGVKFLLAVVDRVVDVRKMDEDFVLMIKRYSEGLLCRSDVELPNIVSSYANRVLDTFERGLELPQNQGLFPDGFFYGQRLLAERAEQANDTREAVQRIRYTTSSVDTRLDQTARPLRVVPQDNADQQSSDDQSMAAGPAVTKRTKRVPKRYRGQQAS